MSRKIGIYGGTFSPPHIGHVGAAESFAREVSLDEILIMPDYLPPHKQFDFLVTEEDRLEMCKRAFSHIEKAKISELEIKRGGKSYTSVTLEELTAPDTELYFLCGTDMFLTLDSWFRAPVIFELATICYVRRECDSVNDLAIEQKTEEYKSRFGAKIIPVQTAVKEISSSELREALKNRADVSDFLPKSVYDYIVEKSLYL